jgi:hypothetical protein
MTHILVGVIVAVLVVCGLIILVLVIVKRRKSNSNKDHEANFSVDMEPIPSSDYSTDYSKLDYSVASTSESSKHLPPETKSWEINYSELTMLETVGEGAFGTVHIAIYRHQHVAVKQLKNRIDKKQVCK